MPRLTVAGNAIVITSTMKLSDLQMVKKYRPEALILKKDDEPVFAISTEGNAGINEFGATFKDESRDGEGFATITMELKYDGEDIKGYIADKIGGSLMNIGKLERTLPAVVEEITADKQAVIDQITIA